MAASRWNAKGFSLLELMVALAIFGAAVGVLLAAHTAASRHEAHARNLFVAAGLLRQAITTTELEGFPQTGDEEGDFGEAFPAFRWRRTVTEAPLDELVASALGGVDPDSLGIPLPAIPAGLGGLRQVQVSVLWEESGVEKEASALYFAVEP